MYHSNWREDVRDTGYKPEEGALVWDDFKCSKERAIELAKNRIDSCKGTSFEIKPGTEDYTNMRDALADEFMNSTRTRQPALYKVVNGELKGFER
jgi:hypothetical protein